MAGADAALPLVHLVFLAGGKGVRCGGEVPKQFRDTGRGPLLTVSLASFLAGDGSGGYRIGSVVVVAAERWRGLVREATGALELNSPVVFAAPGDTRTASTHSALEALASTGPASGDLVAVHDAARPFATAGLLAALVSAADASGGAVPAVPVADTIIRHDSRGVSYLPRETLLAVQTPQVFRWDLLAEAHRRAAGEGLSFTDDGGLLASRDHPPVVVPGEPGNWKVTTEADLLRALDILGG